MKCLLAVITLVCSLPFFLLSYKGFIISPGFRVVTPTDIRTPQSVPPAKTSMSPNADRREHLQRAIERSAKRQRWWMLFVGITLVGYRLFRKHQSLFENSFLYSSYEGLERSSAGGFLELEELPDSIQPVSRARG
jgi:hypothetical protein